MEFIDWEGWGPRLEVLLEGVDAVLSEGSLEDCDSVDKRFRSREPRGVERAEWALMLFLRRGGKYPKAFRDILAISTGFEEGEESIKTQRTCVQG